MSIPVQSRLQIHHPHKPKALTVFAAAFVAGAAAAVGLNRALDVHIAQSKPHVESESIFVALHSATGIAGHRLGCRLAGLAQGHAPNDSNAGDRQL